MIQSDGSDGPDILTANFNGDAFSSWSPDGQRLAFLSFRDENFEIYAINLDGTGLTRLTDNPASDLTPAWSPDGSKIAFFSDRDGQLNLFVMESDGNHQIRLAQKIEAIDNRSAPAWSPDSQKIAFVANNPSENLFEIYVINIDGSGLVQLTQGGAINPAWSPDGRQIAFASAKDVQDDDAEIYVMNVDGTDAARITENPALDVQPTWSPDGQQIAFISNRSGNYDVYIMNVDGSNLKQLTSDLADESYPRWSPPEITLDDEPWLGTPYCLRDTDGDFQPDTITDTFETGDLAAYVGFPYRNMKKGTQFSHVWKPENGFAMEFSSLWEEDGSGYHTSYSSVPTFGAGKVTIQLFVEDRLIQEIECKVVKP
jgi:dipeptidyl aminopeptidase/acylaminoacyl peptidase